MEAPDEKVNVKLKATRHKFENLTITVKNPAAGTSQKPKNKKKVDVPKDISVKELNQNPLLQRLKQLQSGKMSSEQNMKANPLPMPKPKARAKEEETQHNRAEIHRLNQQIQEKIAQQIKPKLRKLLNDPLPNGVNGPEHAVRRKTYSESSHFNREPLSMPPPNIRNLHNPTREVAIGKTTVKLPSDEEVEVYRYSLDDMYELQAAATFQLVPRLQELELCATHLSPYDAFILKLLSTTNEGERLAAILEAAVDRRLVSLEGPNEFKYCSLEKNQAPSKAPQASSRQAPDDDDESKKTSPEIARFKSIAKNDEELNEMIYRHEFNKLFEAALLDQDVKDKTLPEVVKYLIDTNQAKVIEGEIRVNSKNNQEAYVTNPKRTKDVCVSKLILRKHSYHGDFVKVLVKQENEDEEASDKISEDDLDATLQSETTLGNRNFGCVLEILEKRHPRRVIGSISTVKSSKLRKHISFSVRDPKIPNVRVGRDGIPKDFEFTEKMLMIVEITGWSYDVPKGKIVEVIGEKGQLSTENAAILLQHNLNPQPFTQDILDQLPTDSFTIPEQEFAYREDLRKLCIFSIDPETARDLDDALSCRLLPNGNLEIGVHISDVSYFLKENSALDDIVKEKATTIYLVDTVYHMLPVPLCLLCSLLPGADKMAYSVFWEMNGETAEILSTRFTRSILNSCAKLSYDHAQMVIEKDNQDWSELEGEFPEIHNGFTVSDVANVIVQLQKLAVIMRENRKTNGALKIDQPKIAFKFDKDDQRMEAPVDFFKYCIKDSNRLIEEFMLLANISVAKFIYEKFPEISLLRHHDPPNNGGLQKLVKTLQKHGVEIDISSSSAISDSMEGLIKNATAKAGMNAALNLMVSKTMSRARYFCSDTADDESGFWHYALSIPMYTHFTSPIRRYADVLVHR